MTDRVRQALLAMMVLVMVACQTSGSAIREEMIPNLQVNKTTQQQVRGWFGEPTSTALLASGQSVWSYEHTVKKTSGTAMAIQLAQYALLLAPNRYIVAPPINASMSKTQTKQLKLFFDRKATLVNFEYVTANLDESAIH